MFIRSGSFYANYRVIRVSSGMKIMENKPRTNEIAGTLSKALKALSSELNEIKGVPILTQHSYI